MDEGGRDGGYYGRVKWAVARAGMGCGVSAQFGLKLLQGFD